ncbi:helix-turn-helix transcriptional regulator [Streptomyces flavofungini]|uniref:helix-turn-helix transcriptional regulator n=1 Tax=Streptomyces flavofungini TaxID=68200 RepID=UPI0025AF720E|nr:LuxR C-terminal-related transcriptional regulator [Streptomyces flavofungini]WJV47300.1 LuxR C-terminal-related transcriptional regulator [Streptomyces flavofungini]
MEHRPHEGGELCEAGRGLYVHALRSGRIRVEDAREAPCLGELGLLQADGEPAQWLLPVAPSVALPRILHTIDASITAQRQRESRLADAFAPLMDLGGERARTAHSSGTTLHTGTSRINEAIDRVVSRSRSEALAVQPGGKRSAEELVRSLPRVNHILSRGGRMRTLYQHTTRYSGPALAHYEQLVGDVEVRTLDELPHRMMVFDRAVAFIPVGNSPDVALEIRQPAVVDYMVATFDLLWHLAVPRWPQPIPKATPHGLTPRQLSIAALLTEGLTDADIAARLGMNVRTARVHIAKLSAVLKSTSRAQLGYLIGKSGILDRAPG